MRSQSQSTICCRQAGRKPPIPTVSRIVLPGWNCVPISCQSSIEGSLDLVELWKQVDKRDLFVDFTVQGAKIDAGICPLNQFRCRPGGSVEIATSGRLSFKVSNPCAKNAPGLVSQLSE
jgi:hypothetical protein